MENREKAYVTIGAGAVDICGLVLQTCFRPDRLDAVSVILSRENVLNACL
jgi:hypothetical protein